MLCITSLVTSTNQFSPMASLRVSVTLTDSLLPTQSNASCSTWRWKSRSAWNQMYSLSFLSSKRSSLAVSSSPPLLVRLLKPESVDCVGQLPGHHVLVVVDRADDERPVGIAVEEVHDDLVADPRQGEHAVALAGPGLRDAHPARAVLVLLAEPVPVELDLDPAVLVGLDLVAAGTDDDRRLRAGDHRPRRDARRAVVRRLSLLTHRNSQQIAFVTPLGVFSSSIALVVAEIDPVDRADHQVRASSSLSFGRPRVERHAGAEVAHVGRARWPTHKRSAALPCAPWPAASIGVVADLLLRLDAVLHDPGRMLEPLHLAEHLGRLLGAPPCPRSRSSGRESRTR